jgi:voltage-gated potassium channel Kch
VNKDAAAEDQQVAPPPAVGDASGNGTPRHVIIVGFGLSGRTAANAVIEHGISYCVIETNEETVQRCERGGLHSLFGDARAPEIVRQAGRERATDVTVTVPADQITLEVVEQARKLNSTAKIIARCTFVSGGIEAHRRGADDVVIAEQVVATEFGRVVGAAIVR